MTNQPTSKDVAEIQQMVKRVAVEQFKSYGEASPFFAAIGSKEPERLTEAIKAGGLPYLMDTVSNGDGPTLIGFYLVGVPKSLWAGLMRSTAQDIDATAIVFCAESWTVHAATEEEKTELEHWYERNKSLAQHPKAREVISVSTNYRDGRTLLETASIDSDTRALSEYEDARDASKGTRGTMAGLKW